MGKAARRAGHWFKLERSASPVGVQYGPVMGFVVYILRSVSDGRLYVGHTNNLSRRLRQHNDPFARSYTAKPQAGGRPMT
ncbi:MAG TPA: GIY-YIG nuclease family protein [Phycisphaerae bacterium]|nr:GIY-YIG nuclease family protein [Phycisphaerae bacterium]HUU58520.1 GIY-YIG nuclease family protein [Phycisphaerae bacterium]